MRTKEPLIRDVTAFQACLHRLHAHNDAVQITNAHRIKILIRNNPETEADENHFAFDVSLVTEADEALQRATKNEVDVYDDENGCAVLDEFCFEHTDKQSLAKAMTFINEVADWAVCPCGKYLIKDGNPHMCYYCEMTRSADDLASVFCPICHEEGFPRWMTQVPCCKQRLHQACRDACASVSHRCPLCRADWA